MSPPDYRPRIACIAQLSIRTTSFVFPDFLLNRLLLEEPKRRLELIHKQRDNLNRENRLLERQTKTEKGNYAASSAWIINNPSFRAVSWRKRPEKVRAESNNVAKSSVTWLHDEPSKGFDFISSLRRLTCLLALTVSDGTSKNDEKQKALCRAQRSLKEVEGQKSIPSNRLINTLKLISMTKLGKR